MITLKFIEAPYFRSTSKPIMEYREEAALVPRIGECVELYDKIYQVTHILHKPSKEVEILIREV